MINSNLVFVAIIVLAIVAVFQDKIRAWLRRPKLNLSFRLSPPDCHKVTLASYNPQGQVADRADSYYFRVRIKNQGNQPAERVEVFASELFKEDSDGGFKKLDTFLPLNLVWTNMRQTFFDIILPGMERQCDLGHILEPNKRMRFKMENNPELGISKDKTVFAFELEPKPFTLSHIVPAGKYRLVLLLAAANARPVKKTLELNLTGNWHDDEGKMLNQEIDIRIV